MTNLSFVRYTNWIRNSRYKLHSLVCEFMGDGEGRTKAVSVVNADTRGTAAGNAIVRQAIEVTTSKAADSSKEHGRREDSYRQGEMNSRYCGHY